MIATNILHHQHGFASPLRTAPSLFRVDELLGAILEIISHSGQVR